MLRTAPGTRRSEPDGQSRPVPGRGTNRSRSRVQPNGEPGPEGDQQQQGKSRGGERLQWAIDGKLGQQLAPLGSAHYQDDEVAEPETDRNECSVDQYVVGKEDGPAPGSEVTHQGVGQRPGA